MKEGIWLPKREIPDHTGHYHVKFPEEKTIFTAYYNTEEAVVQVHLHTESVIEELVIDEFLDNGGLFHSDQIETP